MQLAFLKKKHWLLSCVTLILSSGCQPIQVNDQSSLTHFKWSKPSMGTVFSAQLWLQPHQNKFQIRNSVNAQLDQFEHMASTYILDSELSKLNKKMQDVGKNKVSKKLFHLLEQCHQQYEETKGFFDPSVLPLVKLWGFDRVIRGESRQPPRANQIKETIQSIGLDKIRLHQDSFEVENLTEHMAIDVGAIGKGYALDQLKALLTQYEVVRGVLSLGEQVMYIGDPENGEAWLSKARHPKRQDTFSVDIRSPQGSIASTGSYGRYFSWKGKQFSHVLNPKTGEPVQAAYMLSVWADKATMADAWSTALFVAGIEKGRALLSGRKGIAAMWVEEKHIHLAGDVSAINIKPLDGQKILRY